MTEQYGFKFVVDANDAAKGWKQFESAVEGVFGALDKMESHVAKTMTAVNTATKSGKTNISAFAKAAGELGRIKVNASAAKNITTLSAAMKSFKAPSSAQVKNTQAFFRALEKAGTGGGATAGKNIAALNAAMGGFKAPSATNVRNLRDFFGALSTFRAPAGLTNAAGFISTLRQLAGFKAPGAAQVRNLQAFLNTVSNLQIPRNGAQIASVLAQIARAAAASNASLRGLRGSIGGVPWRDFNSGAQSARLNMMGLQNAFSGTFQVGSALRVLLGSLTIGELGTKFFEATNAAMQFKAQMSVVNKEVMFANLQLDYVNQTAQRFGVDMLAAESGFAKISIAADKSGISVGQTRHIFEGMTTAMSVLGITTAGQGDVWLALQQVMNKGYLSAEELNQQLNEKLPGAMAYAGEYAAKLGVSLEKGLKTKALDAAGVLEHISRRMKEDFGPAVAAALERPSAQMNILKNNFMMFFQAIGENGGNTAFVDLLKAINEQMTPEKIQAYSRAIGESLKNAVDTLTSAFGWLRENWDSIKGPMATTLDLLGRWMLVSSALQIGRFIVQPLMMIGGATGGLRAVGAAMASLMAVARAGTFMGMVTAANALTGMTGRLAIQIVAARNAMTMMGIAARGAAAGTMTLGAAMGMAARGGVGLMGAGIKGIISLLGGPLMVGLVAGAAAIYAFWSSWAEGHDTLADSNTLLADSRKRMDEITASSYINTTATADNTTKQGFLGDAYSTATGYLATYKSQMDAATGGLYSMAAAAKEATIANYRLAESDITKQLNRNKLQDSGYLSQKSKDVWNDESKGGMSKWMASIGYNAASKWEEFQDVVGLNAPKAYQNKVNNKLQGELAELVRRRKAEENYSMDDRIAEMQRRGMGGNTSRPSAITEAEKTKGRTGPKGPKAPDPAKELDKLQRLADNVARRLGEDNPLFKLKSEYVNDLTEQAQGLLTDSGYTDFMKEVADAVEKGAELTDMYKLLGVAIEGNGADTKILADLKKRLGVDTGDLILLMERENQAYVTKKKTTEDSLKPGYELLKQKADELRLARLTTDQSEILKTVQEEVNKFKNSQTPMRQGEIDEMTKVLTLHQQELKLLEAKKAFYENNGLKKYASEVQTAGEAVQEMDYNVMKSLEDTIFRIGKEGKLSFKGLFDTIQDGLLKFASQGITEKLGSLLSGGDTQNPSIMGGLLGKMGFDTGFDSKKAMDRINAQTVNLYAGRINTNGDVETATSAFAANAVNSDGAIISEAAPGPAKTLSEELEGMVSATKQVGEVMKTDWSGAIKSMEPMFGMALGGALGGLIGGKTGAAVGGIASMLLPSLLGKMGGGGGLSGLLTSLFGGAKGIFKEGGFSDSPVAWTSAPHYSEGTANTSSGGRPAILHDNEAVIPLSRGRQVPVKLTNGGGSGSGTNITNVWNVQSPDADSFKRSQQQITGQMHRAANRAAQRNN